MHGLLCAEIVRGEEGEGVRAQPGSLQQHVQEIRMVISFYHYIIYPYYLNADLSIGAGRVGGPGEQIDSEHSLALKHKLLHCGAHGWPVILGHSLQRRVVDRAVDHFRVPHTRNAPQAVPPLQQIWRESLNVEAAVELYLVHLDVVAIFGSVARCAVFETVDLQRGLNYELVVTCLHEQNRVLESGV